MDAERFAGRARCRALGWDSVTVPGAVSAWVALSERFGRLPFAKLFDAAIGYARRGFHVGPKTAYYWNLAAPHFKAFRGFRRTFPAAVARLEPASCSVAPTSRAR